MLSKHYEFKSVTLEQKQLAIRLEVIRLHFILNPSELLYSKRCICQLRGILTVFI